MGGCQGMKGRRNAERLLNACGFAFGDDENILEVDRNGACITL